MRSSQTPHCMIAAWRMHTTTACNKKWHMGYWHVCQTVEKQSSAWPMYSLAQLFEDWSSVHCYFVCFIFCYLLLLYCCLACVRKYGCSKSLKLFVQLYASSSTVVWHDALFCCCSLPKIQDQTGIWVYATGMHLTTEMPVHRSYSSTSICTIQHATWVKTVCILTSLHRM